MMRAVLFCVLGLVVCVSGDRAGDDMTELGFDQEHRKLSHEQTIKLLAEHFKNIDTNSDGEITYGELEKRFRANMDSKFQAGVKKIAADLKATFEESDTNHDGSLSEDEFKTAHGSSSESSEMFLLFDVNSNGKLNFEEYGFYTDPYQSPKRSEYIRMKASAEMTHMGPSNPGFITYEEYQQHHQTDNEFMKVFDQHDTNSDGKMDLDEFGTFHAHLWGGHSKDPVSAELEFIIHRLTNHRHSEHGDDPKDVRDVKVTLGNAKEHSGFFVGFTENAKAEL